jgi:GT2 family glycosyltransferase
MRTLDSDAVARNLSVVIPLWNQLKLTQQCVKSLLENTSANLEIVFVDDGSSDGTREWLQSEELRNLGAHARVVTHFNESNRGVNYSWNRGLERVSGRFVAVCNNDIIFAPGCDGPLLDALESNESLGIVSPYYTFGPETPKDWPQGAKRQKNWQRSCPILGCCFAFRRELVAKIGPIPEAMRHFYGDHWLAWAVRRNGLRCGYARASYIHHYSGQSVGNTAWQQQVLSDEAAYRQVTGARRKKWRVF